MAQEISPNWIQSVHGSKMAVTFQPNNKEKNLLVVAEKDPLTGKETQKQTIDLALRSNELLSYHSGFYCVEPTGDKVYAVVSKRLAKEAGKFSPERAWLIDQSKVQLVPVKSPKTISCEWQPEGSNIFPFKSK